MHGAVRTHAHVHSRPRPSAFSLFSMLARGLLQPWAIRDPTSGAPGIPLRRTPANLLKKTNPPPPQLGELSLVFALVSKAKVGILPQAPEPASYGPATTSHTNSQFQPLLLIPEGDPIPGAAHPPSLHPQRPAQTAQVVGGCQQTSQPPQLAFHVGTRRQDQESLKRRAG